MGTKVFMLALIAIPAMSGLAQKEASKDGKKLWAAISVNDPVYVKGKDGPLMIHFGLVNDGSKVVDPGIGSTQLFVNGKELKDWPFTAAQGPQDDRFEALPPGDSLRFAVDLRRHFQKDGIYKVSWKGDGFESSQIVFRVISKDHLPAKLHK